MDENIKKLINTAVAKIIDKTSSDAKMEHLQGKHDVKIHFTPKRYRIFGGILQSMNIQFGNFIEELIKLLIENDERYTILTKYSGKKSNSFELSSKNETLIDNYISNCQLQPDGFCFEQFPIRQKNILLDKDTNKNTFKHDIDLLFKNNQTGLIYYLEIKYNDDHDTGKFVDINRKFIKTYAYLTKELNITDSSNLVPILFFFTNKKMKGNNYIPESTNIRRGKKFFEEFLTVKYEDVDSYLLDLSESSETIKQFNDLYEKTMKLK